MSLFDFLMDKPAQPAAPSPTPSSNVTDGLSPAAPQPAPMPAAQPEQPGLLHQLMNYVTSPEGRIGIGTALRSWGGDDGAFQDQARIQQQFAAQRKLVEATEAKAKAGRAFKAAYVGGKFNPQVYAHLMGDDIDPATFATTAKAFAPETKVQDSYVTQTDPITGGLQIIGQRPKSYGEQTASDSLGETIHHNHVEEGQGEQRIGVERGQLGVARQNSSIAAGHLGLDRQQYGFERQKFGATNSPGVPIVTNPHDFASLPSGAEFIDPNGDRRRKP